MAFDFIKVKEKIHIVNIGKCGPEGEGGRGGLGVIQVAACGAKAASNLMSGCTHREHIPHVLLCPPGGVEGGEAWMEC